MIARGRLGAVLATCAVALAATFTPAAADRAVVVRGTDGSDVLTGTPRSDTLQGLGGIDGLHGRRGSDVLVGGAGSDGLHGGRGDDLLRGGSGRDALSDGPGRDVVRAGAGPDLVTPSRDGQPDVFSCGPGRDLVATYGFEPDAVDEFRGCERFDSSCRVVDGSPCRTASHELRARALHDARGTLHPA